MAQPRLICVPFVIGPEAGLKPGDLMVEFDGKPIQNLYDFTYALRSKKPGDKIVVVVKRNGQDIKADVTLEARR